MTAWNATPRQLSPAASSLLADLKAGDNHAVISVYPGDGALEDYAVAYLSNAQLICRDGHLADSAVFTAMYNVRHGLELWFKGVIARTFMDRAARAIAKADSTFATVADAVGCTKARRSALRKALCVLRNTQQDGLHAPECHRQRISDRDADRAVAFLRSDGGRPSMRYFPMTWTVPTDGHDLATLWPAASGDIQLVFEEARYHVGDLDGVPMRSERIEAVVSLLAALDKGGDAFRYPASLAGEWHLAISNVSLSLDRLSELASELENAVRQYRSAADEGVRSWSPTPMLWDE